MEELPPAGARLVPSLTAVAVRVLAGVGWVSGGSKSGNLRRAAYGRACFQGSPGAAQGSPAVRARHPASALACALLKVPPASPTPFPATLSDTPLSPAKTALQDSWVPSLTFRRELQHHHKSRPHITTSAWSSPTIPHFTSPRSETQHLRSRVPPERHRLPPQWQHHLPRRHRGEAACPSTPTSLSPLRTHHRQRSRAPPSDTTRPATTKTPRLPGSP
jgi:hypothetical protein